MGYIHSVSITGDQTYLIEPILYATAGGTSTALTAGISNFTLVSGAYVSVKVSTVGANATLNVNNTGAKDIYYNGVQISANLLTEDNIYTFIYDGTKWNVLGDITGKNIIIGNNTEWGQHYNFVAPRGTILIYSDGGSYTNDQEVTIAVPKIKIGDGSTPAVDLPFVGDDHYKNTVIHITDAERAFWNHKIDCEDTVANNNLILKRD